MRELSEAIQLRNEGHLTEANERLVQLACMYPDNAEVQYQCAWSFDVLGQEAAAVPYYERGIALGFSGCCFLSLLYTGCAVGNKNNPHIHTHDTSG